MITVAQFRADFPEFSSTAMFPDSQVNFYLTLAYNLLNSARFGLVLDQVAELYIAHNIALEAKAQADAASGGVPGEATGPVSLKEVSSVKISYAPIASRIDGAGHWNLTIYGMRFYKLMKLFGMGPIQLGVGMAPQFSSGGWTGPLTIPGFTNFG